MIVVPFFTYPAFTETTALDGIPYVLDIHWNTRGEFWALSISDKANNKLVSGIKVTLGYDLLESCRYLDGMPKGALVVIDAANGETRIAYDDFSNKRGLLLTYVTEAELEAIRA